MPNLLDTRPRICGAAVRLPPSLLDDVSTLVPEARYQDVDQEPQCLLQEHPTGIHHALVLELDGPPAGGVWVRWVWTDRSVRLAFLPDCPGRDGEGGCCAYAGHPDLHTSDLADPPTFFTRRPLP